MYTHFQTLVRGNVEKFAITKKRFRIEHVTFDDDGWF